MRLGQSHVKVFMKRGVMGTMNQMQVGVYQEVGYGI
jgi:hypothetical protein